MQLVQWQNSIPIRYLACLLLFVAFAYANRPTQPSGNAFILPRAEPTEVGVQCGGVDDTKLLKDAATAAKGAFVVIKNGECAVNATTLPNVRVEKGGLLKPLGLSTITVTGVFEAGRYQAFTNALPGQGTISFAGNRSMQQIYPEWWGAKGDSVTDNSPALQAAIAASQSVKLPTSGSSGVPIEFGIGEYLFNAGVTYNAANNASLVIAGQGYSTVFVAGGNITILTLDQGKSSNQGMTIRGIYFDLNGKDAAAIDLKFGGQMAHLEDLWVLNPSATGTKKLIQLGGEVIILQRIMVSGSGAAGALKNSNVGIYLTHAQTFRIWASNLVLSLMRAGLAADNQFINGATYTVRDSAFHGNNTGIDIGGNGDATHGLALTNWLIEGGQFESNLVHINLKGHSAAYPLTNITIADNYFTGIDRGMVAIKAENVNGLSILRNFFKNGTAADHQGVGLSVAAEIRGARLNGNNSTSAPANISPSMTIGGNDTGGVGSAPLFASPLLTVDQNSLDLATASRRTP